MKNGRLGALVAVADQKDPFALWCGWDPRKLKVRADIDLNKLAPVLDARNTTEAEEIAHGAGLDEQATNYICDWVLSRLMAEAKDRDRDRAEQWARDHVLLPLLEKMGDDFPGVEYLRTLFSHYPMDSQSQGLVAIFTAGYLAGKGEL